MFLIFKDPFHHLIQGHAILFTWIEMHYEDSSNVINGTTQQNKTNPLQVTKFSLSRDHYFSNPNARNYGLYIERSSGTTERP